MEPNSLPISQHKYEKNDRRILYEKHSAVDLNQTIGNCDLSTPPTSWLTTSAIGITDWATAGVNATGPNFCTQGSIPQEYLKVAYHIDLPDGANAAVSGLRKTAKFDQNNMCNVQDPRIAVCFPLCANEEWQEKIVKIALTTGSTWKVADKIEEEIGQPNWAITVMSVDYDNPATHLNVSVFLDPAVWCSVYVGVKPKLGFPYLLEIQLGKVLSYLTN